MTDWLITLGIALSLIYLPITLMAICLILELALSTIHKAMGITATILEELQKHMTLPLSDYISVAGYKFRDMPKKHIGAWIGDK